LIVVFAFAFGLGALGGGSSKPLPTIKLAFAGEAALGRRLFAVLFVVAPLAAVFKAPF
jgi:hypothetical protein